MDGVDRSVGANDYIFKVPSFNDLWCGGGGASIERSKGNDDGLHGFLEKECLK